MKKVIFSCYNVNEMWGYGSIGGIGGLIMWQVVAVVGFLQSGDANLLFSTEKFPTEVACKKAIPEIQKGVKVSVEAFAKVHGSNLKYVLATSCVPAEGNYDPSKEPAQEPAQKDERKV